ncbi:hypothetical protein ACOKXV_16585 [Sporosarcina psychrophila]
MMEGNITARCPLAMRSSKYMYIHLDKHTKKPNSRNLSGLPSITMQLK